MNDEMRIRGGDLEDARRFLYDVLASVETAVVALDADGRVTSWNRAAEALWGMNLAQVRGQFFSELNLGLPAAQVTALIDETVQAGRSSAPVTVPLALPSGRSVTCRIACTTLGGTAPGVVMAIDEVPPHSA